MIERGKLPFEFETGQIPAYIIIEKTFQRPADKIKSSNIAIFNYAEFSCLWYCKIYKKAENSSETIRKFYFPQSCKQKIENKGNWKLSKDTSIRIS